jgi:hypothetical protein
MKLISLTLRTLSTRLLVRFERRRAPPSERVANAAWCERTRRWRSGQRTHHHFSPIRLGWFRNLGIEPLGLGLFRNLECGRLLCCCLHLRFPRNACLAPSVAADRDGLGPIRARSYGLPDAVEAEPDIQQARRLL